MKRTLYLSIILTLVGMGQAVVGSNLKEEEPSTDVYSGGWTSWWSTVASNTRFNMTASTETEQQKFPDLNFSMLANLSKKPTTRLYPILPTDNNPEDLIRKRAFLFATGTENKPTYYKGYWFIAEFDYGRVGHTFLGVGQGFSPNGTYHSFAHETNPYKFLQMLKTQGLTSGAFHKGVPTKSKGGDGKTYLVYQFHTEPSAEFYITLTIGRFRYDDQDYRGQFQTRAQEKKEILQK